MTELTKKKRPEFRNINIFTDVRGYRLPLAALVSILHRVSGLLMLLLLPFIIWLFDKSLTSEISFAQFSAAYTTGLGFVPAWFVKLVTLALIWAYLHHLCAGFRHLWLDVDHGAITKEKGRSSAVVVFAISIVLTLALGAKLFGLY